MNHKAKIINACVISALLTTSVAQASFLDAVTYSCSSSLTFGSGAGDEATCSGDFSLSDGVLNNSSYIKLNALGKLTFAGAISLTAPLIELSAASILLNGSLASFRADNLSFSAGDISNQGILNLNFDLLITPIGIRPIGGSSNATISNGTISNGSGLNRGGGNFTGDILERPHFEPIIYEPINSIGGNIVDTGLAGQIQLIQLPLVGVITLLSPVPEPTSYALLLAGLSLIGFAARKKS